VANVEVTGLRPLVRELKGPMFRQVNAELRAHSKQIARDLTPHVAAAVRKSPAPQASAVAATVRPHSDRVPVVVVGNVNPRFRSGVVYGPLGGRRDTRAHENYYKIGRDGGGGHLGRALAESGAIFEVAADLYLRAFLATMRAHGFHQTGRGVSW
jgi:hypothetical protein